MARNLVAITLIPLSLLLLAVGIAQTAVADTTLQRLYRYQRTGFQYDFTAPGSPIPYALISYVPPNVRVSLIRNELGCGALAIATGIFLSLWAFTERDNDKAHSSKAWPNIVSFWVSGATTAVIILFSFTFAYTYGNYSLPFAFPPTRVSEPEPWTSDDFTLPWETWVCRFEPFFTEERSYGWWKKSCALNMASRWLLVPLVILMITCTVLAYFQIVVALRRLRSRPAKSLEKA